MYVYTMHTICFSCVLSEFLVKVCRICFDSGTCPCFYRYVFFINPSVYAPLSWVKFHWTFDPFSVGCWWVLSSSQYIPITGLSCLFPNKFGGVYLFQVNKSLPNRMSLSGSCLDVKWLFDYSLNWLTLFHILNILTQMYVECQIVRHLYHCFFLFLYSICLVLSCKPRHQHAGLYRDIF